MTEFAQGVVHVAGDDLRSAIQSDPDVLSLWQGLTPLGRNEFICWVDDAKQSPAAPLLLTAIADNFKETDAGRDARKLLNANPPDDDIALDRDLLRDHPALLGPTALDLDPTLLDGDAAPVDAESPSGLAIRRFLERVIGSSQAHAPR